MTGSPDTADRAQQLDELVGAINVTPNGSDAFVAATPDWWGERVFGGMVVAQSLSAACKTVHGLRPHSLHAYFFRPVRPGPPTTLTVDRLRDSRSFSTRQVTAEQDGKTTSRLLCSFHTPEAGDEYQLPMPDVPRPDDVPSSEIMPGPYEVRDIGPRPGRGGTFVSSGRFWLRTCARLPDDEVVHLCVRRFSRT